MGARSRERRSTRAARRHFLLAASLTLAFALVPGTASSADPTIDAVGSGYGYVWSPAGAEVAPGGSVTFRSASGTIPHGVTWKGGPETPKCSGVPINEEKTSWSGSCAFAQSGTYAFACFVHPEMTGKVTASAAATPPPPGNPGTPGTPGKEPALEGLKLARGQQGTSVEGTVDISQDGAGSRLKVDLYAPRSALFGPGKAGKARVGGLRRASLGAGVALFSIPLTTAARKALLADERLAVQVKIVIISPDGTKQRRTRAVILRV